MNEKSPDVGGVNWTEMAALPVFVIVTGRGDAGVLSGFGPKGTGLGETEIVPPCAVRLTGKAVSAGWRRS